MDPITAWAAKYNVHPTALTELRAILYAQSLPQLPQSNSGSSEEAVSNRIRLRAAQQHVYLWRNNVGAAETSDGRQIRYGLANDSKRLNETVKSSDFVGLLPVEVRPEHVGSVIGQFIAIEAKRADWRYTDSSHEQAQKRWLDLINTLGGLGCFANNEGIIDAIRNTTGGR